MKPDYYEDFTCIADRCSFTCCREWKIGVDEDTFVKWKHTLTPDGMYDTDRGQQAKKEKLSGYVRKKDGSRVIGLNKEKNCPFLNGKKLCRLVLTYGDEILSQTCQLFPREIHTFNEDVTEYALMPSCPAVIDLLRKREHISFSGEMDTSAYRELAPLVNLRAFLMKLMEDGAHTPEHNLMKIFYVLLDLYERVEDEQAKDGCMENKQVKDAAEDALGLDLTDMAKMYPGGFLLELSETIDGIEQTLQYSIEERNELFLDLAENYRREGLYEKYLEPVAQLAEQLSEQGIDEEVVKEIPAVDAAVPFDRVVCRFFKTGRKFRGDGRAGAVDRNGICHNKACCFSALVVKSGGGELLRRRNFNFLPKRNFLRRCA